VLDVEVQPGKSSSSNHTSPRLWQIIDNLSVGERPYCIGGDIGFGNDNLMLDAEKHRVNFFAINQRDLSRSKLKNNLNYRF
jgi:hypothetical protein